MKKLVIFLLVCLAFATGSLKGLAADGGNVEVEGKIIFYDSSSQENPKKEEPKQDQPTASSSKKKCKKRKPT